MDNRTTRTAGMYRKRLIGLGVGVAVYIFSSSSSYANDTWPHLKDGRVLVTFKYYKLALFADDYHQDNTFFSLGSLSNRSLAPDKAAPTLRDILEKPDIAKSVLQKEDAITIMIKPPEPELHILAQGKFDSSKLAYRVGFSDYDSATIQIGAYPEDSLPCETRVTRNGFFYTKNSRNHKITEHYCLPASQRLFATKRDLNISCRTDSNNEICTSRLYGTSAPIVIGYSFYPNDFPMSDWSGLDQRMKQYFQYILPSEELQ